MPTPGPAHAWTSADPSVFHELRTGLAHVQNVWPEAAGALAQHIFMTPKRRVAGPQHWHQTQAPERPTVPVDGLPVQTYVWGQAPWVLLTHGWDANAASMSRFVDPLLAHGLGVIAFDAPAHGASEGAMSSIGGFARASHVLLPRYTPLHAIIGHSVGGLGAAMALAHLPDLTPRMALLSAPCHADVAVRFFSKLFALSQATEHDLRARLSHAMGCAVESTTFAHLHHAFRNDVLLVHDEADAVVPFSEAEASLRALPGATLQRTSGLGHEKILADATVVDAVVKFVTQPN